MMAEVPDEFQVLPSNKRLPPKAHSTAFLLKDNWNDWFFYQTQFRLIVFDTEGIQHNIGDIKIGQFSMKPKQGSPELPSTFHSLDDRFFSLGQSEDYYLNLNKLGPSVRDRILIALHDVAADLALFDQALPEKVTNESLLRDISKTMVRGQLHRMAQGGARLSSYNFIYEIPVVSDTRTALRLSFNVKPESNPPSNIHVLIGRNGVGKTHLLNDMAKSLIKNHELAQPKGSFSSDATDTTWLFAGLVSVTFSAFDSFPPLPQQDDKEEEIVYAYVGLNVSSDLQSGAPKNLGMLANEFADSVVACLRGPKEERWRHALKVLESDPIFKDADVLALADDKGHQACRDKAILLFKKLSSGHKIVLLTITRLVETVEERTLVLMDEPEAHLHPPLLSAFVRALSDLLTNRNGVAIIATHSPAVLQEVPRECTWVLRRVGREVQAERPEVETFGENVGVLTREIFGLEVTQSGFHRVLKEAVEQEPDFESVVDRFDGKLGAEARAIIRGLIATYDVDPEA